MSEDREKVEELLNKIIDIDFVAATISGKRAKSYETDKVKLRLISIKDKYLIQITEYTGTKVFHKNVEFSDAVRYITENITGNFRQCQIDTKTNSYSIISSKKGKINVKTRKRDKVTGDVNVSHNKEKNYLLPEGEQADFLIELGVMNDEGYVIKAKYDKFRQINRFIEFVEDVVKKLPTKREVKIIDFGCGKSYLTFALYYYLKVKKQMDVNITGLDLKADVIEKCNNLAKKLGYEKLEFLNGDIADYDGTDSVDMVVTLHACDTATDYALAKAVKWNARVIMSVPCCQHEINRQINNDLLNPVLKYGILKERMSALITDGIRAGLLEENGYDTQILEFIDMEHTPKNLLIRAVKRNLSIGMKDGKIISEREKSSENLIEMMDELHVTPTLAGLLNDDLTALKGKNNSH